MTKTWSSPHSWIFRILSLILQVSSERNAFVIAKFYYIMSLLQNNWVYCKQTMNCTNGLRENHSILGALNKWCGRMWEALNISQLGINFHICFKSSWMDLGLICSSGLRQWDGAKAGFWERALWRASQALYAIISITLTEIITSGLLWSVYNNEVENFSCCRKP